VTEPATLRDIAHAAGVSLEIVSRVLNGKYKGNTKRGGERVEQVKAIAERLGYRPDAGAVAMRTRRTRQVGIVVHRDSLLCHPVLLEFLVGINETLETAGYLTTLCRLLDPGHSQAFNAQALDTRSLDGVVVVDGLDLPVLERIAKAVPAMVLVNSPGWAGTPAVMRDEPGAGALAGAQLADLGYRRGVYVRKDWSHHVSYDQRWAGFSAAFAGPGRSVEELRLDLPVTDAGCAALRALVGSHTVLAVADAMTVYGVIDACARIGVRPGIDFGLACLDAQNGMEYSNPGLARVTHDRVGIGATAAALVLDRIAGRPAVPGTRRVSGSWHPGLTAPGPQEALPSR